MICYVKENFEVHERKDLMSELFSSVWLEIKGKNQKILICIAYREFNDLVKRNQMSLNEQLERWKLFKAQVEKASSESLILCMGDMNIDLEKLEESTYYLKKLAEEHQSMIGECGLELLNFGITWSRTHSDGNTIMSAIDQAFTNKAIAICY